MVTNPTSSFSLEEVTPTPARTGPLAGLCGLHLKRSSSLTAHARPRHNRRGTQPLLAYPRRRQDMCSIPRFSFGSPDQGPSRAHWTQPLQEETRCWWCPSPRLAASPQAGPSASPPPNPGVYGAGRSPEKPPPLRRLCQRRGPSRTPPASPQPVLGLLDETLQLLLAELHLRGGHRAGWGGRWGAAGNGGELGGGGCPPQPGPPRPHLVRRFLGNAAPHPGGARHGAAHGGGGHRALRDGTCEQLRRAPSDVGREGSSSTCPCGDKTEGAETEPREVISERRENPERRAGSGYRGEEAVGLGGRCLRVEGGGACEWTGAVPARRLKGRRAGDRYLLSARVGCPGDKGWQTLGFWLNLAGDRSPSAAVALVFVKLAAEGCVVASLN